MAVRSAVFLCALGTLLAIIQSAAACGFEYFGEGHSHRQLLAETGAPAWNYRNTGFDWPGTCAKGVQQSPIAIVTSEAKSSNLQGFDLNFGSARGLKIINTGHAIQVEWDTLGGNTAQIPSHGMWGTPRDASVKLTPFQFHMHSTCEHAVDGFLCPMELHLVTRVDTTDPNTPAVLKSGDPSKAYLAVFGVMYTFGSDPTASNNGFRLFDTIAKNFPTGIGKDYATTLPSASFDLSSLLPQNRSLAYYQGSLTTPPCSEEVSWHVFTQPRTDLNADQLNALQSAMANTKEDTICTVNGAEAPCSEPTGARTNNRALQPIAGRQVYLANA